MHLKIFGWKKFELDWKIRHQKVDNRNEWLRYKEIICESQILEREGLFKRLSLIGSTHKKM